MDCPRRMSKIKSQKSKLWNHRFAMMTSLIFHFAFCSLILSAVGCQPADEGPSLALQIENLTQEKARLQEQIEQAKGENEELKEQLQTLSGLPADVRLENMYRLERIRLGRLSGFFDKDNDDKRETLIVYVTPYDKDGDGIKATGSMNVQLWDLNKPEGESLLGEWDVPPGELKKTWFKTVLAVNYRLTFDVSDKVESFDEALTAKVTFTDYLTGKVFKDQLVIKPR